MPCGTKQPTNRGFGFAAVCASAVAAGTIDSSSGSASAAPAPRSTARRGMCFFVINISAPDGEAQGLRVTELMRRAGADGCLHVHLKRLAPDDRRDDGRESIRCARGVTDDRSHERHVLIVDTPAKRIDEQLFSHDADELILIPHD